MISEILHLESFVIVRMKSEHVLLSADGPHRNVLKLKPPMCFNADNVDEVISKLDEVLSEVEFKDDEVSTKTKVLPSAEIPPITSAAIEGVIPHHQTPPVLAFWKFFEAAGC